MPVAHDRRLQLLAVMAIAVAIAGGIQIAAAQAPPPAPAPRVPLAGAELSARLEAIQQAVEKRREALHIPGAALIIIRGDEVLLQRGFGFRDLEKKLPVTSKTSFAIGSSSKAFTAATMMMAVDDKKLSLSDNPRRYILGFHLRDPQAERDITLRDLLSHRSGLGRTDLAWYTGKLSFDDVLKVAADATPMSRLGESFGYQNVMYAVAGRIVGQVYGSDWQSVVRQRIFTPLGMRTSGFGEPEMRRTGDYALGYDWLEDTRSHIQLPFRAIRSAAPAGAIVSNVEEMGRWVRFMLSGGAWQGRRLLSEASFAELTRRQATVAGPIGYGLGWFLRSWNGHGVVEHGGNIDGFNAQVALMPDQKLGFVLLTNISASSLGTEAMNIVWENLVGNPQAATTTPAPAAEPPADPRLEVGTYTLEGANLSLDVLLQDGKLQLRQPGIPLMTMEPLGGRRYRVAPPAPPNSTITFRPDPTRAGGVEMVLVQGGGPTVTLKRAGARAPFPAPLSAEALLDRTTQAMGGRENLRRHTTLTLRGEMIWESQGVSADLTTVHAAPRSTASHIRLRAAGKRIGEIHDFFNGEVGLQETTFSQPQRPSASAIATQKLEADFYPELNWRTLFKTVRISRAATLDGEETLVAELTPEKGPPVEIWISTRTYLPLQRGVSGVLERLDDYRAVDGVLIPFRRSVDQPGAGRVVTRIHRAEFDVPFDPAIFREGFLHRNR